MPDRKSNQFSHHTKAHELLSNSLEENLENLYINLEEARIFVEARVRVRGKGNKVLVHVRCFVLRVETRRGETG
ncbi:hypothetical protein BPOR_0031g00030 [Botrytis porri]|uniref:Uncharacterized protein n=1 Tax=Botrytis porri TaxID=87229 RepID=A0A4Z1L3B8_9HELO|nr:hypothetical protein BPOR_0031g00030 [Botrytis porri]